MSPEQLLDEGRLDECCAALEDQVRRSPAAVKPRMFLFQLLSILGQWDRANTQLNIVGQLDPSNAMFVAMYAPLLECEIHRLKVFSGEGMPLILGEPEGWVALMEQANRAFSRAHPNEAIELRRQALRAAKPVPGTIDGKPFLVLVDGDSRLNPLLEVIVEGKYYWVPFSRIRKVELPEPHNLHDLIWASATLTWSNGGIAGGFIPVRYCGSEFSNESAVRMGRETVWQQRSADYVTGLGQRMFAMDGFTVPLLGVRTLEFTGSAMESVTAQEC